MTVESTVGAPPTTRAASPFISARFAAFDGKPPCTVRLIVEGMEETNSNLEAFVEADPELFAGDLFVIGDMGNLKVGEPALTTTLRGDVACEVTVATLRASVALGVFGGAAPDAMMAMSRLLATLQDDEGNVAVDGVSRFDWAGGDMSAASSGPVRTCSTASRWSEARR